MTPANPDALAHPPYVLLKRGLFERPGHHGYTGVLRHAGRFSHEEASAYAVHGGSVTMMLASEAPAYSPACWHETQVEDLLDLLRIEREAKAAAEARAAQLLADLQRVTAERDEARATQRDLHRRTQKAERFRERHRGGFNYLMNGKRKERFARRTAEARAAQLQAEVEALEEERQAVRAEAAELAGVLCYVSAYDDPIALRNHCWKAGAFLGKHVVGSDRTALAARAATAREGQADG